MPRWSVTDGRILAEDAFGNRKTDSQEYLKKGDTI